MWSLARMASARKTLDRFTSMNSKAWRSPLIRTPCLQKYFLAMMNSPARSRLYG